LFNAIKEKHTHEEYLNLHGFEENLSHARYPLTFARVYVEVISRHGPSYTQILLIFLSF